MINKEVGLIKVIPNLRKNFKTSWGMRAINAPLFWEKFGVKGEGVKVAIIDTGIDDQHPDLTHAIKLGINMFEKSRNIKDESGHGTHVAGLIAGQRTGVAPNAELYIAKVLDDKGLGSMGSVLDGITFAINQNVDILCMSLGIQREIPVMLQERIMRAYEAGIIIVCATGNQGLYDVEYPARMDEVIGVGGIDKKFNRASFSNYGVGTDVVAPAVDIISTHKDQNYAVMSGTSMASPLVAGGLALILSYFKQQGVELKAKDVKEMIKKLGKFHYDYGYGVFDVMKLMEIALEK